MDLLFSLGNTGALRLFRDAHALATWDVTDFRAEIKVRLLRLWNVKRRDSGDEVDSKRGHPSPVHFGGTYTIIWPGRCNA